MPWPPSMPVTRISCIPCRIWARYRNCCIWPMASCRGVPTGRYALQLPNIVLYPILHQRRVPSEM